MKELASILVVTFFVILLVVKRAIVIDLLSLQGTDNENEDEPEEPPVDPPVDPQMIPVWIWNGPSASIGRTVGGPPAGPIGPNVSNITTGQRFSRSGVWTLRNPHGGGNCIWNNIFNQSLASMIDNTPSWIAGFVPQAQFNTITLPASQPYIFV